MIRNIIGYALQAIICAIIAYEVYLSTTDIVMASIEPSEIIFGLIFILFQFGFFFIGARIRRKNMGLKKPRPIIGAVQQMIGWLILIPSTFLLAYHLIINVIFFGIIEYSLGRHEIMTAIADGTQTVLLYAIILFFGSGIGHIMAGNQFRSLAKASSTKQ